MQKEKKVRTYQRRTKTGKLVTVRQHTAKYDAAEAMKEAAKKKGAGEELAAKKKAKPTSAEGMDFSQADFKAWYHWDQENDPKNPAALKVEKALKAKMGAKGYRKYFNDMSDSYSARGHLKAYKECSACGDKNKANTKTTKVKEPKTSKSVDTPKSSEITTKTTRKQPMPKFKDSAIQRVADSLGVSKQTAQKKMYAELQRRLDSGMSMGKALSTPLFPAKTTSKSSEKEPTKTESKSKRLRRELAEAQAKESRSAVKSATRKSEVAFEKAGVSRKDVSAFMRSSPRKWTYDREEGVYKTMVMPDGKGRARGAYKMSVAAAIKKFQKENV